MNLKGIIILLLVTLALGSPQAQARPMITDLSERKIDINANFTGKQILLYGARVEAGQIVVVMRGPSGNYMVRKKERIAGMWINTGSVKFWNIPQFYTIASSRELNKLDADILLKQLQVGIEDSEFVYKTKLSSEEAEGYKKAMMQKLQKDNLIDFDVIQLPFLEGTLFRIRINFPEKVVPGIYTAEIYSFNEGQLMGMQAIPVKIEKVGIEATIHNMAHEQPALYGIFAILIAASMGWLAGTLFKRV